MAQPLPPPSTAVSPAALPLDHPELLPARRKIALFEASDPDWKRRALEAAHLDGDDNMLRRWMGRRGQGVATRLLWQLAQAPRSAVAGAGLPPPPGQPGHREALCRAGERAGLPVDELTGYVPPGAHAVDAYYPAHLGRRVAEVLAAEIDDHDPDRLLRPLLARATEDSTEKDAPLRNVSPHSVVQGPTAGRGAARSRSNT